MSPTAPPWDMALYARAWAFAAEWHADQTSASADPQRPLSYLHHLASVAAEVTWGLASTPGADGNLAVQCALLHDTLEDTPVSVELLTRHFGSGVASGVQALSKNPSLPSRAAQMADSLRRILQQPVEIAMVKLGDRIANLYQVPHDWDAAQAQAYAVEAQGILQALGHANPALAARLAQHIAAFGRRPLDAADSALG
ncbi:MAG: HD domain-containing protein [Pseudomonadota bacterium]